MDELDDRQTMRAGGFGGGEVGLGKVAGFFRSIDSSTHDQRYVRNDPRNQNGKGNGGKGIAAMRFAGTGRGKRRS